jgi:2-polyprenyl-3-methyl-5-hydroxy-6-metoxy-1,4-benzoquinol methylase
MRALRKSLEEKGAFARLLLPTGEKGRRPAAELGKAFGIDPGQWLSRAQALDAPWDMIVADSFATPSSEFDSYSRRAFCLGIDEGGPCRNRFDYLVDILPRLGGKRDANQSDALAYLDLPARSRRFPARIESVLISFGGEDPRGLSERAARAVAASGAFPGLKVSVVRGGLSRASGVYPEGVAVLDSMPDLKSRLTEHDLVLCQFGLTAYEALAAGSAVLLMNPSPYHEALSRLSGFPTLSGTNPDPRAIASYIAAPRLLEDGAVKARLSLEIALDKSGGRTGPAALADFLLGMELPDLPRARPCVACEYPGKGKRPKALWRDAGRSYVSCPQCGSVSMIRPGKSEISYDESYFFEEYRRQYGKTYLEDMPQLRAYAAQRLMRIQALAGGKLEGLRALDIGCAYGAFLAEAANRGCRGVGIDPAPEAVDYLRAKLGIEAYQGFFPEILDEAKLPRGEFDIVSLWYVAEHLPDLASALGSIRGLLRKEGVLAISTPSGSGISARFSPDGFFRNSPMDHMSVLSPKSLRKALELSGFRLKTVVSTGHHPERFPRGAIVTRGFKYDIVMAASRLLAWGDTFEAYAVKR